MTDYTMPARDDVIKAAGPLLGHISLKNKSKEVIRIDAQGFHYRGQFIEDAGEAHRLLVEFLRQHQPNRQWRHADD